MKKYITWQNSWFTLVELIVSIFIIVLLMSWMAFFFDVIWTWYKNIKLRANTYTELELYENKLETLKTIFTKNILTIWDIFPNSDKWFSLVALTDSGETAWILFWAYDILEKKIKYWNIWVYSKYYPFYLDLNTTDIISLKSDVNTFLSNIDTTKIMYYSKINLLKYWYTDIQASNKSKIDLIFTSSYYDDFYWMNIVDLYQKQNFKFFRLSIIK